MKLLRNLVQQKKVKRLMRLARTFSTNLRKCKQPLYELHIEPLNKEQKKAIRKELMRNQPDISHAIPKQVHKTLVSYTPSSSLLSRRRATFDFVENLIQSTYGSEYELIDMSLGHYATDLNVAPLEFAIYDRKRPQGFLPGSESIPLNGPYDHNVLAKLLQQNGFSGHFVDGDALRISERRGPPQGYRIEELGSPVEYPPWQNYTRFPITYLSYPPILQVEDAQPHLPFSLWPCNPLYAPLRRLLREYLVEPVAQDFVSALYLWTRSINLESMSTLTLALVAIRIIQEELHIPSLQSVGDGDNSANHLAELEQNYAGVWFRAELPPNYPTRLIWIETMFRRRPTHDTERKKIKKLLYSFFETLATHSQTNPYLSSRKVLSIRDAQYLDRKIPMFQTHSFHQLDRYVANVQMGLVPWNPLDQPVEWNSQPLVVVDPFLPSFNHARSMTPQHCSYLFHFCAVARRAMGAGHSFMDLLGEGLQALHTRFRPSIQSYPKTQSSRTEFGLRHYSTSASDNKQPHDCLSISMVGEEARRKYVEMLPPESVLEARWTTIRRVTNAIKNGFGHEYRVYSFGSTQYGVSTAKSDLDLLVIDPKRPTGFSKKNMKGRLPEVYNVNAVGRALRQKGFKSILAIPEASVPIVKFCDPVTGIDCDININDRLGLLNTKMIKAYCDLAPDLVPPMIMTIKRWAKAHDLNDPSGMQGGPVTFSSYTLSIMVIGFLQCKGALPNLQAGLPALSKDAKEGIFWVRAKKRKGEMPRTRCDVRWKLPPASWKPADSLPLGQALYEWFRFWCEEFDYDSYILSIRHGGVVLRNLQTIWKRKFGKIKKNTKSVVHPKEVEQVVKQISNLPGVTSPINMENFMQDAFDRRTESMKNKQIMAWLTADDVEDNAIAALHETDMESHAEEGEIEPLEEAVLEASNDDTFDSDGSIESEEQIFQVEGLVVEDAPPPLEGLNTVNAKQTSVSSRTSPPSPPLKMNTVMSEIRSVFPSVAFPSDGNRWHDKCLVVIDPFIQTKNISGAIGNKQISQFKVKCKQAMLVMEDGEPLEELFPVEDELLDDDEIILRGEGTGELGMMRGRRRGRGVVHIGHRGNTSSRKARLQEAVKETMEGDVNMDATNLGLL